jgi:uncharacterized protein
LGDTARVRELLDERQDLARAFAVDGFTGLQLAAFFGHPDTVELLLNNGADVNVHATNPMKVAALHAGVAAGDLRVCRMLVAGGADVNAQQAGGWAPLHEAAHKGDRGLVDMLLKAGARTDIARDGGETAAMTASVSGHQEIAELLSQEPNRSTRNGQPVPQ